MQIKKRDILAVYYQDLTGNRNGHMLSHLQFTTQCQRAIEDLSSIQPSVASVLDKADLSHARLYEELVSSQRQLDARAGNDAVGPEWLWREFESADELIVGSIGLSSRQGIPIHDHPGSSGILLVFSGSVEVTQYQADPGSGGQRMTELEVLRHQRYEIGDYVRFTESEGNIHSLQGSHRDCLLLDILVFPYRLNERRWYLPANTPERRAGQRVKTLLMKKP
ncbi:MAG: hypothetical protein HUJ29_05660 [Gammaproteobacteria bacterium]|nr:hypothetical protein [Gammaproteobacteria bacterium]